LANCNYRFNRKEPPLSSILEQRTHIAIHDHDVHLITARAGMIYDESRVDLEPLGQVVRQKTPHDYLTIYAAFSRMRDQLGGQTISHFHGRFTQHR
jgi:hypothetical protein